jgi:hypothetical protein
MDLASGSLTDDQKSRGARQLNNGSRTKRQVSLTYPTCANIAQYALQGHSRARCKNVRPRRLHHALALAMISSVLSLFNRSKNPVKDEPSPFRSSQEL